MSIYKRPNSPHYHFDFQHKGHRVCGTTGCTTRKEAEAFEAVEREKAKSLVKAMARSRTSLLMDDVADRFWTEKSQQDAEPDATSKSRERPPTPRSPPASHATTMAA